LGFVSLCADRRAMRLQSECHLECHLRHRRARRPSPIWGDSVKYVRLVGKFCYLAEQEFLSLVTARPWRRRCRNSTRAGALCPAGNERLGQRDRIRLERPLTENRERTRPPPRPPPVHEDHEMFLRRPTTPTQLGAAVGLATAARADVMNLTSGHTARASNAEYSPSVVSRGTQRRCRSAGGTGSLGRGAEAFFSAHAVSSGAARSALHHRPL
jgi:hypothetical protein